MGHQFYHRIFHFSLETIETLASKFFSILSKNKNSLKRFKNIPSSQPSLHYQTGENIFGISKSNSFCFCCAYLGQYTIAWYKNLYPSNIDPIYVHTDCNKKLGENIDIFWNFKVKLFLFLLCLSGSIHNCMVQEFVSFEH